MGEGGGKDLNDIYSCAKEERGCRDGLLVRRVRCIVRAERIHFSSFTCGCIKLVGLEARGDVMLLVLVAVLVWGHVFPWVGRGRGLISLLCVSIMCHIRDSLHAIHADEPGTKDLVWSYSAIERLDLVNDRRGKKNSFGGSCFRPHCLCLRGMENLLKLLPPFLTI